MSVVDKYFFSRLIEGFVCIVWGNVFHSWVVEGMNEFAHSSVLWVGMTLSCGRLRWYRFVVETRGGTKFDRYPTGKCFPLTPSLPLPVKFPGWKMNGRSCKQYIFRSYNIYFQCCVFWWKSCHMPVRKRKEKDLSLSTFNSHFQGTSRQRRS